MRDAAAVSGNASADQRLIVAADIGGTFTDILVWAPGHRLTQIKALSTPGDYGLAIIDGVRAALASIGANPATVAEIRHATTIASNTILEKKGARVGLIGTVGFRDVLEIRNLRMPVLYDFTWEKPEPLVPRLLRTTVTERIGPDGAVLHPLDSAEAKRVVSELLEEGIDALAVCLINSFANPIHERAIAAIAKDVDPRLAVSLSSEVLPEIKEYERTSTTVVNAYVGNEVRRYLSNLSGRLAETGIEAPLRVMQSNGSLMTREHAIDLPVHIIESGPAAGVVAAQAAAEASGIEDVISFDMGGTTAKASLIEGKSVTYAPDFQVGGGLISGSRLLTGAGYLVKVPAIDIAEVGAGGGSIIHIDRAGGLKVGPISAGAYPGPVCYGFGGRDVTITDANIILGYVSPTAIAGGAIKLDRGASVARFEEVISRSLNLPIEEAAHGAFLVATSTMIRAIRAVTVERGRDPRRFGLVAFGGNGPIFAHSIAEALGIKTILIPPHAGLFSAVGLLVASSAAFRSMTFRRRVSALHPEEIEAAWSELEGKAVADLGPLPADARIMTERRASLRYVGQRTELVVTAPDAMESRGELLAELFAQEHLRTYGHRGGAEEPVEIVNLQVICHPGTKPASAWAYPKARAPKAKQDNRLVYFGPKHGWKATPVIDRSDLVAPMLGPLIVEEPDTACVVPPGFTIRRDVRGNMIMSPDDHVDQASDSTPLADVETRRRVSDPVAQGV